MFHLLSISTGRSEDILHVARYSTLCSCVRLLVVRIGAIDRTAPRGAQRSDGRLQSSLRLADNY